MKKTNKFYFASSDLSIELFYLSKKDDITKLLKMFSYDKKITNIEKKPQVFKKIYNFTLLLIVLIKMQYSNF